jgi:hypothetical protein
LLQRGEEAAPGFSVNFDAPATSSRVATTTEVGRRNLIVMRLKAKDTLTYRLQFAR